MRAYLQLGVAALGTLVLLRGLLGFAIVFPAMPRSESGFAEGLAIIFYGAYVLAGFVLLAAGLLIPQHGDNGGIQFSAGQRKLLAYGVVAPIVGVIAIPVVATFVPPLSGPVTSALVAVLIGLLASGPLATLLAVGSKLQSVVG